MKKLIITTLALGLALASCVKDEVYVAPPTPPVVDSPLMGQVVLNEINGSLADDQKYIEMYNNTNAEIDLSGCKIYYNNATSEPAVTWTGAAGKKIPAKGFLVLSGAKGLGDGDMTTGLSGTQAITVEMKDADGKRIDIFQKSPSVGSNTFARIPDGTGPWYFDASAGTKGLTNGTTTAGKSLIAVVPEISDATRDPGSPTPNTAVVVSATVKASAAAPLASVVLTWSLNSAGQTPIPMTASGDTYSATIPGQANGAEVTYTITATDTDGGVATAQGSYTVSDAVLPTTGTVYINECDPTLKKWEFYNPGLEGINLEGWTMYKDNGREAKNTFVFPAGATIAAGGYLVLTQNEAGSPTFGMSGTSGFKYELFDSQSTPLLINVFDNLGDNQLNNAITSGQTMARVTDGSSIICTFSTGSLGAANATGTPLATPYVLFKALNPTSPTTSDAVTVAANVSFSQTVTAVQLTYNIGAGNVNVAMTQTAGTPTWTGTIPKKTSAGTVTYKLTVTPPGTYTTDNKTYDVTAEVIDFTKLVINEIDGTLKFIELYNTSATQTIPLTGLTLTKNDADLWWTGPDGATLAPGAYYTISNGPQTGITPNETTGTKGISAKQTLKFELKNGSTTLDLFIRTYASSAWGDACYPDYGIDNSNVESGGIHSFCRIPDGAGAKDGSGFVLSNGTATCGVTNGTVSGGAIVSRLTKAP